MKRARLMKLMGPVVVLGLVLLLFTTTTARSTGQDEPSTESGQHTPPEVSKLPSRTGEVVFPHQMHYEDFEIECTTCHHEMNAARLHTPHPEYFADSWVNCSECHTDSHKPMVARHCNDCHPHFSQATEEAVSARVALHKACSQCHEIGTGVTASKSCEYCHTGPKSPW